MFSQSMRYLSIVSLVLAAASPGFATSDDRGTVGIFFAQLFDDNRLPSHRGPLVVLQVMDESAAAKAGIHSGDFVIAVDEVPRSEERRVGKECRSRWSPYH